jgi:predicted amino acid-binding ACT domain protein
MSEENTWYVISVLARDHVGIIADVSEALFDMGANVQALSQTVVGDWFTMVACASFSDTVDESNIKASIGQIEGLQAIVVPSDGDQLPAPTPGEPFVVTAIGDDRPGIVAGFARCFTEHGVNIEDVWNEVRSDQFIQIFHVTVPPTLDPKELGFAIDHVAKELEMSARLQHQDIFTATNSLSVRTRRKGKAS